MRLKSNFVWIVFLVLSVWFFQSYFDSINSYAQPFSSDPATNDSVIDTIKFEGSTGTIAVNQKTI